MRRVAVIVTPGVGDDAHGQTAAGVADGLIRHGHFEHAAADELTVPPPRRKEQSSPKDGNTSADKWVDTPESSTTVARRRLARQTTDTGTQVLADIYEMRWADLSRFPSGLRRMVLTVFALLLDAGRVGREALRKQPEKTPCLGYTRAAILALVNWLAFVVVPVTALVTVVGGLLWASLFFPAGGAARLAVGVTLALGAAGLFLVARGLRRIGWDGWGVLPTEVLVAVTVAVSAIIALLHAQALSEFWQLNALPNLLLAMVAVPLRLVWIVTIGLWSAVAVGIAALFLIARHPGRDLWRGAMTALLASSVPPIALALAASIALGAVGAVGVQLLGNRGWSAATTLQQIEEPDSWGLGEAPDGQTPSEWLTDLYGTSLAPLGLIAALLLVVLLLALTGIIIDLIVAHVARLWGTKPVHAARTYPAAFLAATRYRPGCEDLKELIGSPRDLGLTLSSSLRAAGGRTAAVVTLCIGAVASALVLATWIPMPAAIQDPLDGVLSHLPGPGVSAVATTIISVLLLAGRFLPGQLRADAGAGRALQRALDVAWDIATYMRPHESSARFAIVDRFRALIASVLTMRHRDGDEGYDGVVFVSHSQGTVYTAATLFGDENRTPRVFTLTGAGQERVRDALEDHPFALFTCGSPIRQTYAERFPSQYDGWIADGGELRVSPQPAAWVNAYRPGDYVGRSIHVDANTTTRQAHPYLTPGTRSVGTGSGPRLIEVCLDSTKGHTGYWTDEAVARDIAKLIDLVATPTPGR